MPKHRTLVVMLSVAASLSLAGCGAKNGPTAAENAALRQIAGARRVLSYPIAAGPVLTYLPAGETRGLGEGVYVFAVHLHGHAQPAWVIAGPLGAHRLESYGSLAALQQSRLFPAAVRRALAPLAAGHLAHLPLAVVGLGSRGASGAALRKFGLKLPASAHYTVVSLLTLPQGLHGNLGVANFVTAGGRLRAEFGSSR